MNDREDFLASLLNLQLPDEISCAVMKGTRANGLDAAKISEAFRCVYAVGFYDGAVGTHNQGPRNDY